MKVRLRVLAIGAALGLAFPLFAHAPIASAADSADCAAFSTDLQQVARPTTDASLLTTSTSEATGAANNYGFTEDLGVLAKIATRSGTGLVPVWRLYKSGDFAWATEGSAADAFVADGYSKRFIAFYAAPTDSTCVSPLIQLSKNGIHRIARVSDVAGLTSDGWSSEASPAFFATTGEEGSPTAPGPDPAPPVDGTDTTFSIAVLPDTQNETYASSTRFENRVSWLVANEKSLDLRYMLQVGDLTNWGNVDPAQFAKVSKGLQPLEAEIPWAGAIGNHDTGAVCSGGSACVGSSASVGVRVTSGYNTSFPVSRFRDLKGTFEANKVDNSYHTFSAGGVDWLVLSLELWPRKDAVSWAKAVVAANPDKNVIVLTHAYLEADGSISQSNGGYGATSPQYLYDNLIKVYPNIKMVFSGHVGTSAVRTDTGINGNKIVSILTCYHSSTNPTRILTIDTAAGTAKSTVYAPATNTSFPSDSTSTSGLSYVK